MTDPKLKKQLSTLTPGTRLTVVLQWPVKLDRAAFAGAGSAKERLALLDEHFQVLKGPVLSRLADFSDVVVKDLPASGSVIVTTTAGRLGQLVNAHGLLGRHSEIEVLPNEPFYATAEQK